MTAVTKLRKQFIYNNELWDMENIRTQENRSRNRPHSPLNFPLPFIMMMVDLYWPQLLLSLTAPINWVSFWGWGISLWTSLYHMILTLTPNFIHPLLPTFQQNPKSLVWIMNRYPALVTTQQWWIHAKEMSCHILFAQIEIFASFRVSFLCTAHTVS